VLAGLVDGKAVQAIWRNLKCLPIVRGAVATEMWGRLRHRLALHADTRPAHTTFTQFLRLPRQYDVLAGPVVDLLAPPTGGAQLTIVVIGCANGAEPYSIASILRTRRPRLRFTIRAFDISEEMVACARRGEYATDEIFCNTRLPAGFVDATFERRGDVYRVRPDVSGHVTIECADVLDPALARCTGTADVLYLQNLLFNLPRAVAARAFANALTILRPQAALFLDGMDLDMRADLTRRAGLVPLDVQLAEIHDDARAVRAAGWPWSYWGLEPWSTARRDWRRRYGTIFLKQPRLSNAAGDRLNVNRTPTARSGLGAMLAALVLTIPACRHLAPENEPVPPPWGRGAPALPYGPRRGPYPLLGPRRAIRR
jgi:chemotaxis methyl-accepting protein methylase